MENWELGIGTDIKSGLLTPFIVIANEVKQS
jgi:hypothetical protein